MRVNKALALPVADDVTQLPPKVEVHGVTYVSHTKQAVQAVAELPAVENVPAIQAVHLIAPIASL